LYLFPTPQNRQPGKRSKIVREIDNNNDINKDGKTVIINHPNRFYVEHISG
jgi:hypothetical protein